MGRNAPLETTIGESFWKIEKDKKSNNLKIPIGTFYTILPLSPSTNPGSPSAHDAAE
jgi:hypothetical protein